MKIKQELPPYDVLSIHPHNIEFRKYAPSKWIACKVTCNGEDLKNHYFKMISKLVVYTKFKILSDRNSTVCLPVTVKITNKHHTKINRNSNVEMSIRFFVPKKIDDLGTMSLFDARVEKEPPMSVATIAFTGYPTMDRCMFYKNLLVAYLGSEAANYDCTNMIIANYDHFRFNPFERKNEIWLCKNAD